MPRFLACGPLVLVAAASLACPAKLPSRSPISTNVDSDAPHAYLGFDLNEYPGDTALTSLRQTFSFVGYWLNKPPGTASNTWVGERATLLRNHFGFLVLFNGRVARELRPPADPAAIGVGDARIAVEAALHEGFSPATVIFLDQEEGGRLLPGQRAYLFAWVDSVIVAGFRAGIYCSGIPAKEGKGIFVVTANDIREHAGERKIEFFTYNDACPPSPGCAYWKNPPLPSASGASFATVWQFAQSPRRRKFTNRCASSYAQDGNCYPPGSTGAAPLYLDLDTSTSPNPSGGHR